MANPHGLNESHVFHNVAQQRFELRLGEALCVLDYRRSPGRMAIYHTEVPPSIQRQGFAALMTRAAFDFARAENLLIEPRCPYTAAFVRSHPEFNNLVAQH
jgi:uncharacterized protein